MLNKLTFYFVLCLPALIKGFLRKLTNPKKIPNPKELKKILFFQMGHFGDIILSEPLLRNLKQNNPASEITVITGEWNKELISKNPDIDHIIIYNNYLLNRDNKTSIFSFIKESFLLVKEINRYSFDLGIDVRGHINSLFILYLAKVKLIIGANYCGHGLFLDKSLKLRNDLYEKERLLELLSLVNIPIKDSSLNFPLSDKARNQAEIYLAKHALLKNSSLIALFPGASFTPKRWPEKSFAELANLIIQNKLGKIVLLGGKDDKDVVDRTNTLINGDVISWIGEGKNGDIDMLAGLLSKCNALVANDTGPTHLATALNVKSTVLFGPTNAQRWADKERNIIIDVKAECSPCALVSNNCPLSKNNCIEGISVEEVYQKLKKSLE
ncbi:MAG: glycosyltransferase family 9 protein [Nitrospinae bacterium]|nr:glycosyltransferase family 9 protein [Nitrospinota bacterium]